MGVLVIKIHSVRSVLLILLWTFYVTDVAKWRVAMNVKSVDCVLSAWKGEKSPQGQRRRACCEHIFVTPDVFLPHIHICGKFNTSVAGVTFDWFPLSIAVNELVKLSIQHTYTYSRAHHTYIQRYTNIQINTFSSPPLTTPRSDFNLHKIFITFVGVLPQAVAQRAIQSVSHTLKLAFAFLLHSIAHLFYTTAATTS